MENKPMIFLGIIWFLVFMIPGMFIRLAFTMTKFEYLECRAYLPSIGIFITEGILLNEIIKGKGIKTLQKVLVMLIVIFSILTFGYSHVFADPLVLYSDVIQSNPNNAFALNERGSIHIKNNEIGLALVDYDNSIKISPEFSNPYFNKGALYNYLKDHNKAEHFYSLALKYDTLYPEAMNPAESSYLALASEKLSLKKYDEAIEVLKKGLWKYPDNSSLRDNLDKAKEKLNLPDVKK